MTFPKFTFLWICLAVLVGCESVDRKNVYTINAGDPRKDVEAILGDAVEIKETDLGSIYTYETVVDARERDSLPDNYRGCGGGCAMAYLIIMPVTVLLDASGFRDEKKRFYAAYDTEDNVVVISEEKSDIVEYWQIDAKAGGGDKTAQNKLRLILEEGKSIKYIQNLREKAAEEKRRLARIAAEIAPLASKAEQGDLEAQYHLGTHSGLDDQEKWIWLCRAAHQGHIRASNRLAASYFHYDTYERLPMERNLVKAYSWYAITMRFGSPTIKVWSRRQQSYVPALEELRNQMTRTETAEAERLVSTWEPSPAKCEAEVASWYLK